MNYIKLTVLFFLAFSFTTLAHAEKVIRISTGAEVTTLDPTIASGKWEAYIITDAFATLMKPDNKGKVINGLAESYTVSKDGKTYVFKLRDAKWSDGVELTANDVEFSLKHVLNPETGAIYASLLYDINGAEDYNQGKAPASSVGVKAIDAKTLEITLVRPASYFIEMLAHATFAPIPEHVYKKHGKNWANAKNIVTSGAYKITARVPGSTVTSVKNPYYYDADKVKIDKIIYYVSENQESNIQKFRAKELDLVHNFAVTSVELMQKEMPKETYVNPGLGVFYLSLNLNDAKLKDVNVRKAISLAVNRESLARIGKSGEVPAYSFIPYGLNGYTPYEYDWKKMPYEERVKEAKKLLEQAGYTPAKPLRLEFLAGTSANNKQMFVSIADDLKPVGIQLVSKSQEHRVVYHLLSDKNYEMGIARWVADYPDAQNFLFLGLANSVYNYASFSSEGFDKLLSLSNNQTGNKRFATMQMADKILLDSYTVVPTLYTMNRTLVSSKVVGFIPNAMDINPVEYLDLK